MNVGFMILKNSYFTYHSYLPPFVKEKLVHRINMLGKMESSSLVLPNIIKARYQYIGSLAIIV